MRRILAASERLLSQYGFDGTTVQQIADEAVVAVGTLFLYVSDKSEILLRLFRIDSTTSERRFSSGASGAQTERLDGCNKPMRRVGAIAKKKHWIDQFQLHQDQLVALYNAIDAGVQGGRGVQPNNALGSLRNCIWGRD